MRNQRNVDKLNASNEEQENQNPLKAEEEIRIQHKKMREKKEPATPFKSQTREKGRVSVSL